MKNHLVFKKIINRQIPANIIYQDKIITAFTDINPQAPVHILIIPNIFIKSSNDINSENKNILGHMFYTAVNIAKKNKISKEGYRIIINCNKNGGQEIDYLHMHLLGGKQFSSLF